MMTVTRLNEGLCALLIAYVGASCAVQLQDSAGGLVRWSGFSVLVPVAAAALLPLRRSLIIGGSTLAATVAIYGFAIHGVSAGGRAVVITAVALSFAFGLVICWARPHLLHTPATATRNPPSLPRPAGTQAGSAPDTPRAVPASPRGVLPEALPQPAVVELAGHYRTGSGQLGMRAHWLDAIPLSGTRVGLVAGAVAGPGADATASELRTAVRTLADIDLQPEELLTHLDDVLARLRPDNRPGHDTRHHRHRQRPMPVRGLRSRLLPLHTRRRRKPLTRRHHTRRHGHSHRPARRPTPRDRQTCPSKPPR